MARAAAPALQFAQLGRLQHLRGLRIPCAALIRAIESRAVTFL